MDPNSQVTITISAAAARIAALELSMAVRSGALGAALLDEAAQALHAAGWAHLTPEAPELRRNRALVERGPA